MTMPRVFAFLMIAASAAAQAQQQPAAPAQPVPPPTAAKVEKVCRIHMDMNIPRRVCMTKEQWAKVDASGDGQAGTPGYDRQRCNSSLTMGAC
jgi:hypothetical protein